MAAVSVKSSIFGHLCLPFSVRLTIYIFPNTTPTSDVARVSLSKGAILVHSKRLATQSYIHTTLFRNGKNISYTIEIYLKKQRNKKLIHTFAVWECEEDS